MCSGAGAVRTSVVGAVWPRPARVELLAAALVPAEGAGHLHRRGHGVVQRQPVLPYSSVRYSHKYPWCGGAGGCPCSQTHFYCTGGVRREEWLRGAAQQRSNRIKIISSRFAFL